MKQRRKQEAACWKAAAMDMLYLTKCGIHSAAPEPERVAQMDMPKVYALCRSQSLEAITYLPLERLKGQHDTFSSPESRQVLAKWEEGKNKAIRKILLMDGERKRLTAFLEENKIWYLPLKGVILCPMYPELGMRQISDNDILFDPAFREAVRDWFAQRGYTVASYAKGNHDEYHKAPVYNFEMHTALFHDVAYPQMARYYADIRDRLLPVDGKHYEYCMSDEDFYLYMLAHEYKHHSNNGTGVRSLLDVYVYNTAKGNLNRAYLDGELDKLGLREFERDVTELANKLFGNEALPLTEEERKLLGAFLVSGTYGTVENHWRKQVKKSRPEEEKTSIGTKLRYFSNRLFPSKSHMEKWCELYAPYFLSHRYLLPAARILRFAQMLGKRGKSAQREFDTVWRM